MKAEPREYVYADIAKRFEVLDRSYLKGFIGPIHIEQRMAILKVLKTHGKQTQTNELYKIEVIK